MVDGKLVIACRGEGIDGITRDKENGLLIKSKDINNLVEAIGFLLFNPEKGKEISQRTKK